MRNATLHSKLAPCGCHGDARLRSPRRDTEMASPSSLANPALSWRARLEKLRELEALGDTTESDATESAATCARLLKVGTGLCGSSAGRIYAELTGTELYELTGGAAEASGERPRRHVVELLSRRWRGGHA